MRHKLLRRQRIMTMMRQSNTYFNGLSLFEYFFYDIPFQL